MLLQAKEESAWLWRWFLHQSDTCIFQDKQKRVELWHLHTSTIDYHSLFDHTWPVSKFEVLQKDPGIASEGWCTAWSTREAGWNPFAAVSRKLVKLVMRSRQEIRTKKKVALPLKTAPVTPHFGLYSRHGGSPRHFDTARLLLSINLNFGCSSHPRNAHGRQHIQQQTQDA